jgi:hypothetical protein
MQGFKCTSFGLCAGNGLQMVVSRRQTLQSKNGARISHVEGKWQRQIQTKMLTIKFK